MRRSPRVLLSLLLVIVLAVGGKLYLDWKETQPVTLRQDLPQLEAALAASHWVSPGLSPAATNDRAIYMVSFRSCPYCIDYEQSEFPRLQKAGVDTRVILLARRDLDGKPKSTAPERATVAQLWRTRDWGLYQRWTAIPVDAWASSGQVPPSAEADPDRMAAVEAGRAAVDRLRTILGESGVELHYPALIWRTGDGRWRTFIGYDPKAAATIRAELGAG